MQHTPIVKLRELVEERTGVPTHQQQLTIGSTIVEDWDNENRMMFIGDYPNIHDGSLLYLVQLEGGSRMKVEFSGTNVVRFSRGHSLATNKYCYQTSHFFVNHIKVRITDVIITQTVVLFLTKIRTCMIIIIVIFAHYRCWTWAPHVALAIGSAVQIFIMKILRFYFLLLKVGDKKLCQPTINAGKSLQSTW